MPLQPGCKMWKAKLVWMMENQPQVLKKMLKDKTLEDYLADEQAEAWMGVLQLQKQGLTRQQAEEVILSEQVAPLDPDREPGDRPVDPALRKAVRSFELSLSE